MINYSTLPFVKIKPFRVVVKLIYIFYPTIEDTIKYTSGNIDILVFIAT